MLIVRSPGESAGASLPGVPLAERAPAHVRQIPEIYRLDEFGTLGVVPRMMTAWVIREERFGDPMHSFKTEVVPVPEIGDEEVLVRVVATGVNYNSVWAGLGKPVSVLKGHGRDYHVPGSDAAGIVWKVGAKVKNCKIGDEVLVTCNWQDLEHGKGNDDTPNFSSFDPMSSPNHLIHGYETPDGTYAQFTKAQAQQILPKPKSVSFEEAASYILTYFTAYRMLITRGALQSGELALIWGGAGGVGSYAIQLCREIGADAIAVVSDDEKGRMCMELGAIGYINRKEFAGFEYRDNETPEQTELRMQQTKAIGKKIWSICGERRAPDLVLEHPGAATFPASVFLCARFGRVVTCGATTGYNVTFDIRHLWMHQKRIIGSHYANFLECRRANALVEKGKITALLADTYDFDHIPHAHQALYENKVVGNLGCLIMNDQRGLKTIDDLKRVCGQPYRLAAREA